MLSCRTRRCTAVERTSISVSANFNARLGSIAAFRLDGCPFGSLSVAGRAGLPRLRRSLAALVAAFPVIGPL